MTDLQRQCLEFYKLPFPARPVTRTKWNNRQLSWALDYSYVAVEEGGWHELTATGRQVLARI